MTFYLMKNQSWWDLKRCNASKECVGKLLFGHKKPLFHLVEASCTVKNLKDEELHSLLFTSISLSLFFLGCFIVSSTACKRPGFSVWYHKLHIIIVCLLYSRFLFKKKSIRSSIISSAGNKLCKKLFSNRCQAVWFLF